MASTMYSVFIPRVFINITEERLVETFKKLDIGLVGSVQLIRKTSKDGTNYWMAFIHFKYLYDTEKARQFKEDVEDETKQAKLVYEDPWYWLVLPFRKKETSTGTPTLTGQETQTNQTYLHYGPTNNMSSSLPVNPTNGMVGMIPIWVNTPQGLCWYWGYANQPYYPMTEEYNMAPRSDYYNKKKLVPRQAMYGKNYHKQRKHPKKRIQAPSKNDAAAETSIDELEKLKQLADDTMAQEVEKEMTAWARKKEKENGEV